MLMYNVIFRLLTNTLAAGVLMQEFLNDTSETNAHIIYGIQRLNCDNFLPKYLIDIMNSSQLMYDQNYSEIPEVYLHKCLFNDYNADIKPYQLVPKSVIMNINYSFAMNELMAIEHEGKISISARIFLRWFEPRFRWNLDSLNSWKWPKEIKFPAHKIWVPTLSVQNCQKKSCPIQISNQTTAYVASKGRVWIRYSDLVEASCDLKLKNFPFDTQECEIIILFNNLAENSIINQSHTFMVDYMVDNEEWMVTNIQISECEMNNYTIEKDNRSSAASKWQRISKPVTRKVPAFKAVFISKRECGYFVSNLIVPILLVLFISITSLCIDAREDHRAEIQLTVMLAFVFFQSVLAAVMPQTRGSPRLCRYVMYSMLVSTVELIITFVLRGLHNFAKSTKKYPYRFLIRILFIPRNSSVFEVLKHSFKKFKSLIRKSFKRITRAQESIVTLNKENSNTNTNQKFIDVQCAHSKQGCFWSANKATKKNYTGCKPSVNHSEAIKNNDKGT